MTLLGEASGQRDNKGMTSKESKSLEELKCECGLGGWSPKKILMLNERRRPIQTNLIPNNKT